MTDTDDLSFRDKKAWAAWLRKSHGSSPGIWMRIAKKASGIPSVTAAEALDVALCYGWIDGQRKAGDETTFLQRYTPRGKRSTWSKINRDKALALIASGDIMPAGLAEVERAKADGRWDRAYDSYRTATVPPELQAALDKNTRAKAFFATLSSQNRYAILFRIMTAKKPETKAKRIKDFVAMLARKETLYP